MLSKLKEQLNSVLPKHNDANIIFRGLSVPIDRFLSGNVRFAKKIGEFMPVVVADNYMELSSDLPENSDQLFVKHILHYMSLGCLIRIGGLELKSVTDFSTTDFSITLDSRVETSFLSGAEVLMYAYPLSTVTTTLNTQYGPFRCSGDFRLYNGDVLCILSPANVYTSFQEIEVERVELLNSVTNECSFYLKKPVSLEIANLLVEGDRVVYVRAYPAYSSSTTPLSITPLQDPVGLCILDFFSSMLYHLDPVRQVRTLRGYTYADETNAILETTEFQPNSVVVRQPILSSSIILWDLVYGTMNLRNGWVSCLLNAEGKFCISTDLVPNLPSTADSWGIVIMPKGSTNVRASCQFIPNDAIVQTLLPNVHNSVIVSITPNDATRLEITLYGAPGQEVWVGDFSMQNYYVEQIQYDIVGHVTGNYTWFTSGAIVKPYFRTVEPIGFTVAGEDSYQSQIDNGVILYPGEH